MNELKMSITLPLVIVLFVYGVYCPGYYSPGAGIHRPETPEYLQGGVRSSYPLLRCVSHSSDLRFDSSPSATYAFEYDEALPSSCELAKRSTEEESFHPFERADVTFNSMLEEEIRLTNVSSQHRWQWSVTCYFPSVAEAQQFYKLIIRDRRSELAPFGRAEYLKNSDNIVLAEQPNLYSEGDGNVTIVVKNDEGDAVLIFQRDTVAEITQPEPTQIELFIRSRNPGGRRLYKLGFSSSAQATALIELIGELRQLSEDSESASEQSESDSD